MSEILFLVEEDPGGGLVARGVGVSIFTQAATLEERLTRDELLARLAF